MTEQDANSMIWCAPAQEIPFLNESELLTGFAAAHALLQMSVRGSWQRRGDVEEDTNWRQVIPYVFVQNAQTAQYLMSTRTKEQSEKRLHLKVSVGFGGHIEQQDQSVTGVSLLVEQAARREVQEETSIVTGLLTFAGIISVTDPHAEPVHRVHVGVLYHLLTPELEFKGEDEKHVRKWVGTDELLSNYGNMERWSQVVIESYLKQVPVEKVAQHHHHHHKEPTA